MPIEQHAGDLKALHTSTEDIRHSDVTIALPILTRRLKLNGLELYPS